MHVFDVLSSALLSYQSLWYWRNVLEIIFFSSLFYYAAIWLKKDRQKNLVFAFYSYCTITFVAHFLSLTTISYVMFLFAPVVTMIFILLHQEFLQKNFVTFKNITPAKVADLDWLETLIRTMLVRMNCQKELTCIIEHRDSLAELLVTPLSINARIVEQGLLDLLLSSPSLHDEQLVWITAQGHLVGINAQWKHASNPDQLDAQIQLLPTWKQDALFFTTKTDAIVLHLNATNRTFDVIINGTVIDRMHAAKTLELLKKYIISQQTGSQWGGIARENNTQKRVPEQHSH